MLLNRLAERAALGQLLNTARGGQSGVLVVRGIPGIGKTALLEDVIGSADGLQVARVVGVESEMELAYAALQQLCAPMMGRVDRLPRPQRDSLGVAFGLQAGQAPDRFLVGLATLSLLSEVAAERPLLCVIDDAQWLDQASVQALGFVARRLMAERVALLVATRERDEAFRGLPELVLEGLDNHAARELLASVITGPLDERVMERVIAETHGNPLALLESPRALTPADLVGGFGFPDAPGLPGWLERSFRQRFEALSAAAQRLLLVAAAEPTGDAVLVWRAVGLLGIGMAAAADAEAGELVKIGEQVTFQHPLVRSAIYHGAALPERKAVHQALADATDPQADADRRACHLAQAADGPDEEVAGELERAASRARSRGGVAAAGAFLERSAALTSDLARRSERVLSAAHAKYEAGALTEVLGLLAAAQAGPLDAFQRARLSLLRGEVAFASSRGSDAPPLLLEAARMFEPLNARLARDTYLAAFTAVLFTGRLAVKCGMREVADAARTAPPPQPERPQDLLLEGLALLISESHRAGIPVLKRAVTAFRGTDVSTDEGLRWLWLACHAAGLMWDYENCDVLSAHQIRLAREAGAPITLPLAFNTRAGLHLLAGEFAEAASLVAAADSVTAATQSSITPYGAVLLAAMGGEEAEARELIETTTKDVLARGEGEGLIFVHWATAVLCNGLGRYEQAMAAAQQASDDSDAQWIAIWAVPELIEAATRSGVPERAARALPRLLEATRASGTDWALGIEARSRALVTDGDDAAAQYREAIDHFGRTRLRVELARAHLLYGEWLRRQRRIRDARDQLRSAYRIFDSVGAGAFAERSRIELRATGDHAPRRTAVPGGALTAQEALIARLAGGGASNPQIAARMFISSATVAYHLRKVFAKLGVSSRTQLTRALAAQPAATPPVTPQT
jgi:DNA-binding CsgD family transcriptional regulator